jgi:hypothetical protein
VPTSEQEQRSAYGARRRELGCGLLLLGPAVLVSYWGLKRPDDLILAVLLLMGLLAWSFNFLFEAWSGLKACKHGVSGAEMYQERCPACTGERIAREEREALRRRSQEEQEAIRRRSQEEQEAIRRKEEEEERQERRREAERQRRLERKRARAEHLRQIRLPQYLLQMDPERFEELVGELYESMGFKVEVTRYQGDHGVDAFVTGEDGKVGAVQAKRYDGTVGEGLLRNLYGAMHHYNADFCEMVTTGRFTRGARRWAEGKPINLVDGDRLRELVEKHFGEEAVIPEGFRPVDDS